MKKIIFIFTASIILLANIYSQSDDDLFGDDDFFFDDMIEEVSEVSASSDLSKGIVFENGSMKIGGSLSASAGVTTVLYADDDKEFADRIKETELTPSLGSSIFVDAHPTQDLRLYSKFTFNYPFTTPVIGIKEMFTDFNAGDYVSFRFGLHTVTWGTGLFYSPVSDMINTSSIDPEHRDEQVDGSLNLRTLINFPGSMNNLWFYVIPDTGTKLAQDTALALKSEFVFGGWELGAGAFYKYNTAPRAMLTASGSIKKWSLFGEAVYQYGSDREWLEKQSFEDKNSIFKATVGFMRSWSDQNISLLAQYYYDGNDFDASEMADVSFYLQNMALVYKEYPTKGHNASIALSFGKLFDCKDLSLSLLGIANFTKPELIDLDAPKTKMALAVADSLVTDPAQQKPSQILDAVINGLKNSPRGIFSATLNYAFNDYTSLGFGPYITFADWKKDPVVSLKINFSLGGGKF